MRNIIQMALDKANRLDNEQLAEEIGKLERGEYNHLRISYQGTSRKFPLYPIILRVFREVQQEGKSKQEAQQARRKRTT